MPIKKSALEKKWYYRLAKIFFLLLPWILILLFLLNKNTIVCDVSTINIKNALQQNIPYIIFSLILYFLILIAIWRILLYVIFDGLENDDQKSDYPAQKKDGDTIQSADQPVSKKMKLSQLIPIVIILFIAAVMLLSATGYIKLPKINPEILKQNSNPIASPKSKCPATSAQTSTPCHSAKNGVGVSGVITYGYCDCPSDTTYAGMDNITPGGPYKICNCK